MQSNIGLNAANFFLAEMVGVILPFLAIFLKRHNWTYDQIGVVKERFNTLLAIMQTALALGAMIGPLIQGYLTYYLGFNNTFIIFAVIASLGAFVFITKMPETRTRSS